MGFWDDQQHHPSSGWPIGHSVEGTLTALEVTRNSWGNLALRYQLDGQQKWASRTLWEVMAQARVDVGDRIRITKTGEDASNGKVRAAWQVDRIAAPVPTPATVHAQFGAPIPAAAAPMFGPQW